MPSKQSLLLPDIHTPFDFRGSDEAVERLLDRHDGLNLYQPFSFSDQSLLDFGDFDRGGVKGGGGGGKPNKGKPDRNDDPTATDDSGAGFETLSSEAFTTRSVLDNDFDPDGDTLTVTGIDTSQTRGQVTWNGDGTFTYDPAGQFDGMATEDIAYDQFSYTVEDGRGGVAEATVTIAINSAGEVTVPSDPPPGDDPDTGTPFEPTYYVEALLAGDEWRHNADYPAGTPTEVTFAFADSVPEYYSGDSFVQDGFAAFGELQQDATRAVLDDFAGITGLTFTEVPIGEADIVFGMTSLGQNGFAYFPTSDSSGAVAGDVWISDVFSDADFEAGSYGHKVLIHEICHALGLQHPEGLGEEGTQQYTVMTAYGHPSVPGLPETLQLYDVEALRYLYGEGDGVATGDDTYSFDQVDGRIMTIHDDGGTDTLDMSGATRGVDLDLGSGSFSSVTEHGSDNLALSFGTQIENAIGGDFDDILTGNDADNVLTGGAGSDVFRTQAQQGADRITDFENGTDIIEITGASLADLMLTDSEGGILISLEEGSLFLEGVSAEELDEEDFLFV